MRSSTPTNVPPMRWPPRRIVWRTSCRRVTKILRSTCSASSGIRARGTSRASAAASTSGHSCRTSSRTSRRSRRCGTTRRRALRGPAVHTSEADGSSAGRGSPPIADRSRLRVADARTAAGSLAVEAPVRCPARARRLGAGVPVVERDFPVHPHWRGRRRPVHLRCGAARGRAARARAPRHRPPRVGLVDRRRREAGGRRRTIAPRRELRARLLGGPARAFRPGGDTACRRRPSSPSASALCSARRRSRRARSQPCPLGFLGVVAIVGTEAAAPAAGRLYGVAALLASACCVAGAYVWMKGRTGRVPPLSMATLQSGSGLVVLAAWRSCTKDRRSRRGGVQARSVHSRTSDGPAR